eukprot:1373929-Rhodomonas_salina.1
MSGTELAHGAICLRALSVWSYALPGTDLAYAPTGLVLHMLGNQGRLLVLHPPIVRRVCNAMSSTDIWRMLLPGGRRFAVFARMGPRIALCVRYAMCGTEIGYDATLTCDPLSAPCAVLSVAGTTRKLLLCGSTELGYAPMQCAVLRYAVCGTDLAYGATLSGMRCAVLTWRMVLRYQVWDLQRERCAQVPYAPTTVLVPT